MTNKIVPIRVKKECPVFGESQSGDVWFDPYKGIKILVCCPNCGKRLYVLTKKEWKTQKSVVADECCGISFSASTQGFFLSGNLEK